MLLFRVACGRSGLPPTSSRRRLSCWRRRAWAGGRDLAPARWSSPTSCAPARGRGRGRRSCGSGSTRRCGSLGDAYEGISLAEIARAFGALARIAHEIADELEQAAAAAARARRPA